MRILGLGDGFGAGVALIEDGAVQFAISEERLSRIKNHSGYYHGFPDRSIAAGLEATGWDPESIGAIAVSNFAFPPLPLRLLALSRTRPVGDKEFLDRHEFSQTLNSRLYSIFSEQESSSFLARSSVFIYRRALARKLNAKFGLRCPIEFIDHHRCHASSAYFTQAEDDCLVATLDCHGDGLSGTLSVAKDGRLDRITTFPATDSLGSFYAAITNHLGFHHHRHEGKVTGLAALGDPTVAYEDVARMISYDRSSGRLQSALGRNQFTAIERVGGFLRSSYKPEDIAAAAQRHFETIVLEIIGQHLRATGKHKLLLAGGLFGNVKLNQRLNELPEVDYLFVHPGMGDEGLPVGAALALSAERGDGNLTRITDVFWGTDFGASEVRAALDSDVIDGSQYIIEHRPEIDTNVALLLAEQKIVARCSGRMEYGPRALGNRSILFHAGDPSANDWLNKALKRTEFMPFAPMTLSSHAHRAYINLESAEYSAAFMTVCFDCHDEFRSQCPAVVHVDGTARPQLVNQQNQPGMYRVLTEYEKLTGIASLINTSFNIHEEPIVCTPTDALRALATANLDHLALGDYLISRREPIGNAL
jgi:carbamoyltransferase